MTESEFIAKITLVGGKVYIVGGYVRDFLLQRKSKDKDYLVCGLNTKIFQETFPLARLKHKDFPVFLLCIDEVFSEISLARREIKKDAGYKGFNIEVNPNITLEEDLQRRDTTMNAMAISLPNRNIIDLFNGRESLQKKEIRAISARFAEDPVRALRLARQAAELDFKVEKRTLKLAEKCHKELKGENKTLITRELLKALGGKNPPLFFHILHRTKLLGVIFPQFAEKNTNVSANENLQTMLAFLAVVVTKTKVLETRFSVLGTFFISSLGEKKTQLEAFDAWQEKMHFPKKLVNFARFFLTYHQSIYHLEKASDIVNFLLKMHSKGFSMREFLLLLECEVLSKMKNTSENASDIRKIPLFLQKHREILSKLLKISGKNAPSHLQNEKIANWVFARKLQTYQEIMQKP